MIEGASEATRDPLPFGVARVDGPDGHGRRDPLLELDAVELRARSVQVATDAEGLLERVRRVQEQVVLVDLVHLGRGDTPEVTADHALRVGVVLRRHEVGAVAAEENQQQVRHGREAVEVRLEAQLLAQEEALEARRVLGQDAHLAQDARHDRRVPLRKVRWCLVLEAMQCDNELDHRWHVLGVCPALVENLPKLRFAREAGILDELAEEAPDVLKIGRDGEP